MARYDVISGKIANDQTNATIVAYMTGLFGQSGSTEADETCRRLLIPNRLHDQHCFRTTAADLYDDSLKYWWDGPSAAVERYKTELVRKAANGSREV